MLLNRLLRPAVSCLFGHLPFKFLKGAANIIALGLLFIEFILEFKRHLVVAVLCFLQLDSSLVNLRKNVEILVFIHRSFVSFVDEDVVFISNLLDFGLHHFVVV